MTLEEEKFYWLHVATNIVMATIGRNHPGKGWVEIDKAEYERRIDEQEKDNGQKS